MKNYTITVNGTPYSVTVEEGTSSAPAAPVAAAPAAAPAPAPAPAPAAAPGAGKSVCAPMPGNVLKVNVKQGDTVKNGQCLIILEAMKMENEIMASRDGVIASVNTTKGSSVEAGAVLCTLA